MRGAGAWVALVLVVTARAPLAAQSNEAQPESLIVRMPEHLHRTAHVWRTRLDSGMIVVREGLDVATVELRTSDGTVVVSASPDMVAAWGDSAAALSGVPVPGTHGGERATVLLGDKLNGKASVPGEMRLLRFSADSNAGYQLAATNGAWGGHLAIPAATARRLFAALRGEGLAPDTMPRECTGAPSADSLPFREARFRSRPREPAYPYGPATDGGGRIVVAFAIDSTGHPVPATLQLVQSTNLALAISSRDFVEASRFWPAMLGGHPICHFMQLPIDFVPRPVPPPQPYAPAPPR